MPLTIDELGALTGTTTRTIRSFQTLGLLDHPELRGRTGLYTGRHVDRLHAIRRLQDQGFSLQSLAVLFHAYERGESLGSVLGADGGAARPVVARALGEVDDAELYGFTVLQGSPGSTAGAARRSRVLLSIVPSTLFDQSEAS
ncbi:MAG TPA: MerR family transcriptional regulator [Acidimicrobiales bacterium]